MRIGSPLPHRKARIEIIPLIDIMFFLLAAFMMASLSMIRLQSVKMELPSAASAKRDFTPDIINIGIDQKGDVYLETKQINLVELNGFLSNKFQANTNVPVFISGDKNTRHGSVVRVLDAVRRAGIQKISFTISPEAAPAQSK
jgi:biopolymer transport protein ExbD